MLKHLLIICLISTSSLLGIESSEEQFNFQENSKVHYIKYSETLARIALENNVSVAFLLYLNEGISNPNRIKAGQKLKVPNIKAQKYIKEQSKAFIPLIDKMGAMKYKERNLAIKEMIKKDWLVIPILLQALKHEDVEIRENAKLALREIHQKKVKISSTNP